MEVYDTTDYVQLITRISWVVIMVLAGTPQGGEVLGWRLSRPFLSPPGLLSLSLSLSLAVCLCLLYVCVAVSSVQKTHRNGYIRSPHLAS